MNKARRNHFTASAIRTESASMSYMTSMTKAETIAWGIAYAILGGVISSPTNNLFTLLWHHLTR